MGNRVDVNCQVVPQQEVGSVVQLGRLQVPVPVQQLLDRVTIERQSPLVQVLDPVRVQDGGQFCQFGRQDHQGLVFYLFLEVGGRLADAIGAAYGALPVVVVLSDLEYLALDPSLLESLEHDEQGQLVPDGLRSVLDLAGQYLDPHLLVRSCVLADVQSEEVLYFLPQLLPLLHYLQDLFRQELLVLLSSLEDSQQVGQLVLGVLDPLEGVLPPDQGDRDNLGLGGFGRLVHSHVVTEQIRLGGWVVAAVGQEGRSSHQDAALIDPQSNLRELLVGHEHLDHDPLRQGAAGALDETLLAVDGN